MVRDYVRELYAPAAASSARVSADDFANAKSLALWRTKVLDAWPGVSVLFVDSQMTGDATLGSHLTLRAEVALNGLTPPDVCVEAVYGSVDVDDRLLTSTAVRLEVDDTQETTAWFVGEIPLDRTGPYGYTVRVLPHNDLLASSAELGVVATA
jgi:starch phosphorylase